MAFSAVALYYDCCPTTPPTRHYISLTRTANIYEMHEWIVIPGMPGYLDVCMHDDDHEASELSSEAYGLCSGVPEVGSDASELSSEA